MPGSIVDEDIPNDAESPPIAEEYDPRYSEQENNVYKGPMIKKECNTCNIR
jgi:hypothetical protein